MKMLVLLMTIFGCHVSNALAEPFCIATYNLNWGNRRGDQVLDAISTAKPDLVCFQETTVQSERYLRGKLSDAFPHFTSVGHRGRYGGERFAFASKTPLSKVEFTPPGDGLFGFYSATVSVGGTQVRIVNVHLTPFALGRGVRFVGSMAALSDAEEKHASEITAISASFDPKFPAIVLGDFNSVSTFVAPKFLAEIGLTDSFASVNSNADANPTWTWPTRPLPISLRIDYIFHTSHFSTTNSAIIQRDGSDHFLVVSELNLETPTGG